MKTPVVFMIFNRPDLTKLVFEAIRLAKPEILFVIADGPRTEEERVRCAESRAIIESGDWKCDIRTNYSDKNLGCGKRISSGIDWVFSQVDMAIFLEDDCLPHPSFFPFCEELLERFKDDERIMEIGGIFLQQGNHKFSTKDSYYGSILPHLWGWATWRRAWKKYDFTLTKWPEIRDKKTLAPIFKNPAAYERWSNVWDQYYYDKVNNWDAQWVFSCALNNGICLNPTVNLVTNIGFGENATHGKTPGDRANIPIQEIKFPLIHPREISINYQADAFTFRHHFGIDRKLRYRLIRPVKTAFPKTYRFSRSLLKKLFD